MPTEDVTTPDPDTVLATAPEPLPAEHAAGSDAPETTAPEDPFGEMLEIAQQISRGERKNAEDPAPATETPPGEQQQQPISNRATAPETPEAPDAPADAGPPTEQGSTAADPIDPDRLERARQSLQRALSNDVAEDVMAHMSDRAILDRGEKLAKQQADQDRAYQESQRLKQQVDELVQRGIEDALKAHNPTQPQGAPGQPAGDAQPSDLAQAVKDAVVKAFEQSDGLIDDDVRGPVQDAMVNLAATLEQQFETRLGTIEQARASQVQEQMNALALQRDRLEMKEVASDPDFLKEYPELRQRDVFERVCQVMYRLADVNDPDRTLYFDAAGNPRWHDLMTDAARLTIEKRNPTKQAQVAIAERQRAVTDGQPVAGTRHGQPLQDPATEDQVHADLVQTLHDLNSGRLKSPAG